MIPFVILWSIWKERNDSIFRSFSSSMIELTSKVAFRIAKCSLIIKEFSRLNFDDILSSWGSLDGVALLRRGDLPLGIPLRMGF